MFRDLSQMPVLLFLVAPAQASAPLAGRDGVINEWCEERNFAGAGTVLTGCFAVIFVCWLFARTGDGTCCR